MPNVELTVRVIEFVILDTKTICNVYADSTEWENPIWGKGWRYKEFGKDKPVADFINDMVGDYIEWPRGRMGAEGIMEVGREHHGK